VRWVLNQQELVNPRTIGGWSQKIRSKQGKTDRSRQSSHGCVPCLLFMLRTTASFTSPYLAFELPFKRG
jgi:hypothetical protein